MSDVHTSYMPRVNQLHCPSVRPASPGTSCLHWCKPPAVPSCQLPASSWPGPLEHPSAPAISIKSFCQSFAQDFASCSATRRLHCIRITDGCSPIACQNGRGCMITGGTPLLCKGKEGASRLLATHTEKECWVERAGKDGFNRGKIFYGCRPCLHGR